MMKKKTSTFQFQVGHRTHPIMKEYLTHREQIINMFLPAFQDKTMKYIKDMLQKNIY